MYAQYVQSLCRPKMITVTVFDVGDSSVVLEEEQRLTMTPLLADLVTGRRLKLEPTTLCRGLFSAEGYGASCAIIPVHECLDDASLVGAVKAKLPELHAVAERFYSFDAIDGSPDTPLAMGVHSVARPHVKRSAGEAVAAAEAIDAEDVTYTSGGSGPAIPTPLAAHGILGVSRVNGNTPNMFFTRSTALEKVAKKIYDMTIFSSTYKVEVKSQSELPRKFLGMALENDIWAILLNDVKVYEKQRNYPLKNLLECASHPIIGNINGSTRKEALVSFKETVLPDVRKSGVMQKVAEELEGARFKDRDRSLTEAERRMYSETMPHLDAVGDEGVAEEEEEQALEEDGNQAKRHKGPVVVEPAVSF